MTKQYPRGKIFEDDEGELTLRIGVTDKTVIIDFGKQLKWIGYDKSGAIEFAELILKHARSIK